MNSIPYTTHRPVIDPPDITALQESNDRANAILNNSKEIILTVNLEANTIAYVNDAISILGYKPSDWIDKSYKWWHQEQCGKFYELMKLAVQSQLLVKNQTIFFPHRSKTHEIAFEFSTAIFYLKKKPFLLCVLRDVRERLQYEEKVGRISNQLTHLLNNIDDVYVIFDLKTSTYDFVSDNVEALYGCEKEKFCADNLFWKSRIYKQDLPAVEEQMDRVLKTGLKEQLFYRINSLNGERKSILEKLVVTKDDEGKPAKLFIVKTDYTKIENAERSLLETERKFRFISENLSDFISIHDTDWNFTYASPSIQNILGYHPTDVVGKGAFDLVHPDDLLKTLNESIQPTVLYKRETKIRYRMLSATDTYKWVETYAKPVLDSKEEISSIICSTRDVTEQVEAEAKLKKSEEQYRLISENSNDLIGIHDLDNRFLYVSPSCRQVLGYEQAELLGRRPHDVFVRQDGLKQKEASEETVVITSQKERRYLSTVVTKTGEEKKLEVWLKPVFKEGELVALQSASRDVTEREKLLAELKQSLEKERELNELRAKFVSTASHQFRTPLTVIQSGVELMELYIDDLPQEKQWKFQKQFCKIQEEVARLEHLMNDVLLLGRANASKTPFNPGKKSVVEFCQHIIDNKYNNRFAPDRQVVLHLSGTEVPVSFDEKLLGHAIENIISNAYKYSNRDCIYVDIIFEPTQVIVNVTDTGIGIPEKDIKNLFQPFYRGTNTAEIEGTGLGLSIVKEFVEKHGGKIFLSSKLNKGTTVSVILPID